MSTLNFGITTCATAYGLSQSAGINKTAEIAEGRDCDGKMHTLQAYSVGTESTADVLITGTLPDAGTVISLNNVTGIVTTVNVSETNTGFQSGQITIRTADSTQHIANS
jgi:hypothetical protein